MDNLDSVLYYLIEKTNKVIRRYSQEQFNAAGLDITVDQWLVMKKINDSVRISQVELATAVFKDTASITRILVLLMEKGLVEKESGADKRVYELSLTPNGKNFVETTTNLVKNLRLKGIEGMSTQEVENLSSSLKKIMNNLK